MPPIGLDGARADLLHMKRPRGFRYQLAAEVRSEDDGEDVKDDDEEEQRRADGPFTGL